MPILRPFVAAQLQQLATCLTRGNINLLLVNTAVSGGLYGLGDICQQKLTGNGANDWTRTLRMTALGILMGPVNHYWYFALDVVLPGRAGRTVLKKVLADQLVMAPVCCVIFYTGKQLLRVLTHVRIAPTKFINTLPGQVCVHLKGSRLDRLWES